VKTVSSISLIEVACLNINSLTAHIDELRVFMRDSKIDILAINESKLDIQLTTTKFIYQVMKLFGETDKLMVVKVVGFASTYVVSLILKYARSL